MSQYVRAKSASAAPTAKVTSSGAAGAFVLIVVWALDDYADVQIPPEVAAALTTLLSFAAGYLTKPKPGEVKLY